MRNRHDFTNLKDYAFAWEICRNGEKTASGTFSVDLLPHGQKDIRLDLPEIPDDGNEYFLNLYAYTKAASGLLPAGYEVAKEQLKLGEGDFFTRMPGASGNLEYRVEDGVLVFASGDVSGKIDLKKGVLSDYAIRACARSRSIRNRPSGVLRWTMISGTRCRGRAGYGVRPMSTVT